MIPYFLKSILCLGILLLVYLLFLEKEKMHRFNRWYLLGSIVFACIVPLISFTLSADSLPVLQNNYFDILQSNTARQPAAAISTAVKETVYSPVPVLLFVYGLITFVLLARFTRNLYLVLSRAGKNKIVPYDYAKLVLVKDRIASYSFLNYIFISEEDYQTQTIEKELITHELTHVKEKHSWDVIFIELLQVIFWFNPLFIFYKKAIQLNHEYLADEAVIKTYEDVTSYQYLLLDKASCNSNTCLTSNFNYSVTKKRLVMMTRTTNQTKALLKKLAVIPVIASAILLFSDITLAQNPPMIRAMRPELAPPSTKDGIPPALQQEFDAIVTKHLTKEKGRDMLAPVTGSDRSRLQEIFFKMTNEQQATSKVLFEKRIPHKFSGAPSDAQFESFKDPKKYGVWLNGKKINSEELNKYKAGDFGNYWWSNLNYTDKMREDVMKMFNLKVMYEKQLMLFTTENAEKDKAYDIASIKEHPYTLLYRVNERTFQYVN